MINYEISLGFMILIHIAILDESEIHLWFLALQIQLPSSELTYPTLGKAKSSSNIPWGGRYVSSQEGIRNI